MVCKLSALRRRSGHARSCDLDLIGRDPEFHVAALKETDCVAGHVRLELRNVGANYPFVRSRKFRGQGGAAAVGVFARRQCHTNLCGVRGNYPFGASHQSRSAMMQATGLNGHWRKITPWHLADSKRSYASGPSWRALEPFLCLPNDHRCRLRPAR